MKGKLTVTFIYKEAKNPKAHTRQTVEMRTVYDAALFLAEYVALDEAVTITYTPGGV